MRLLMAKDKNVSVEFSVYVSVLLSQSVSAQQAREGKGQT